MKFWHIKPLNKDIYVHNLKKTITTLYHLLSFFNPINDSYSLILITLSNWTVALQYNIWDEGIVPRPNCLWPWWQESISFAANKTYITELNTELFLVDIFNQHVIAYIVCFAAPLKLMETWYCRNDSLFTPAIESLLSTRHSIRNTLGERPEVFRMQALLDWIACPWFPDAPLGNTTTGNHSVTLDRFRKLHLISGVS